MSFRYIELTEVFALHDHQLKTYGGASGIRDMGQLEAALYRPQTGYYSDLVQEAAALWESLLQNHPFVDGNKRTAFAVMHVFLLINGLGISKNHQEAGDFIYGLFDAGKVDFVHLEDWLRANTRAE